MGVSRAVSIRRAGAFGLAAVAAIALAITNSGSATAADVNILGLGSPDVVQDSYVVVLKDTVSTQDNGPAAARQTADSLATQYGGKVTFSYHAALSGFAATMSEEQARNLAADPRVSFVEADRQVRVFDTQPNPPSWGLDRIDQVNLPLDSSYTYPNTASNVNAYIIDTGIRITHQTFGGRAVSAFDAVDGGTADDCQGHGTHVAGTVGGTEYGVAKGVTLHAVRVLDCNGSGTYAQVVAGIDWVTANAVKPAVANMSLGGGGDAALDTAVQNSIASGVTYAVASGNSNTDACGFSPARVPEAITVNATDINDARASFSNFGTCTDIFAPGVNITSSWNTDDTATNTISGTSMATPHVAGAAALYLSANPGATPQQVRDALVAAGTDGLVTNPGAGSPNDLLNVGGGTGNPPTECTTKDNATRANIPDAGAPITSAIAVTECGDSKASASTKVKVDIVHTYRGDLVIDLIAPSGAVFNLKAADFFDSADNVNTTFTVNAAGENANGTWTLRVQDVYSQDVGSLQSWSITV
jgi:subtilisin family serine protease